MQSECKPCRLEHLSFLSSCAFPPSAALLQLADCSRHERWCQRRDGSESHACVLSFSQPADRWKHTPHPGCSWVGRSSIAPGEINGSIPVCFTQTAQFRAAEQQLDNNRTPADICITPTAERIDSLMLLSGGSLLSLLPVMLRSFSFRNTPQFCKIWPPASTLKQPNAFLCYYECSGVRAVTQTWPRLHQEGVKEWKQMLSWWYFFPTPPKKHRKNNRIYHALKLRMHKNA